MRTTLKSKHILSNFESLKSTFLDEVVSTITMEEIN